MPVFIGLLLVAMVSIQAGATVAKQLFPLIGIEATSLLRVSISALLLSLFWRPWRGAMPRAAIRPLLIYGLALGGMNLVFYYAIARIPLGIAVALEFTGPLAVALLGSRRPMDFLWAVLAALGIVFILPIGSFSSHGSLDPLGILFALAAGAFWAVYIVAGERTSQALPSGRATAIGMAIAALVILPAGAPHLSAQIFDRSVWVPAILLSLFSSAIPYSLEMVALKRLPTRTFGILMSLEPAFAAISGLLLLSEQLTSTQWIAIGCVMAASAGSAATARPKPDTAIASA